MGLRLRGGNGIEVISNHTFRLPRAGGDPRIYQPDVFWMLRRVVGSLDLRLRGGNGVVATSNYTFRLPRAGGDL